MKYRTVLPLSLLLLLPACSVQKVVSPADSMVRSGRHSGVMAQTQPTTSPLPSPSPAMVGKGVDEDPRYSLALKQADLLEALALLSRDSGIPIVSEPGVSGKATISVENRPLGEILFTMLRPLGYQASVENGVIVVGLPKLVTRAFYLNYTKDKRSSTSSTNASISAAGGNGNVTASSGISLNLNSGASTTDIGSGSGGNSQQGNVSVTTSGTADFWDEVTRGLETIIFGGLESGKGGGGSNTRSDSRGRKLVINQMAGVIYVTDSAENLNKIGIYLADVEQAVKRQVLIQAHIVEVALKDTFSLGIDWEYVFKQSQTYSISQGLAPVPLSNAFNISITGSDFNLLLDAMKTQGDVNTLSSPKISTMNNQRAVIKLTTREVTWVNSSILNAQGNTLQTYTTPQIDEVGIFLDVTPNISPDGLITMQIHPSISEIKSVSVSPDNKSSKPVIDVREVDTMVDIRTGETVVIAGLIVDRLRDVRKSVPFFGELPLIGPLFSNIQQERGKTELVIMLTPYLLNEKNLAEIRAEHEKRLLQIDENYKLINTLRFSGGCKTAPAPEAGSMSMKGKAPAAETTPVPPPLSPPLRPVIGTPATAPASVGVTVKASSPKLTPATAPAEPAGGASSQLAGAGGLLTEDFRTGLLAYKKGECSRAIPAFDRFLKEYPDSPQAVEALHYRTICKNFQ